MFARDEIFHHTAAERTWTIQRHQSDDVFQIVGLQLFEHSAQTCAFKLENADGVTNRQHLIGLWIIVWYGVKINLDAISLADGLDGLIDHRQGAQAKKIHFQKADGFYIVFRILGDDRIFLGLLQGQIVIGRLC